MGFTTKQVHAGVTPDPVTGAILTPIYQSTTFVQDSVDQYLSKGFSYSRSGNPTVRALEQKIAVLENGKGCTCYSTGMAAEQVVFQATLSAGDHAIISDVAYGGTYRLATKIYSRFGVQFTFVDTANPGRRSQGDSAQHEADLHRDAGEPDAEADGHRGDLEDREGARHSARRRQHVPDAVLPAAARARRQHLGAQHDEVLRRPQRDDGRRRHLRQRRARPEDAVSSERDGRDHVAVRRVADAAGHEDAVAAPRAAIGERASHRRVPREAPEGHASALSRASTSFPQHALAKEQASGFGAMLWFEVEGGVKAGKKLMDSVKLCTLAENLGSVETLITHPVTMTHAVVEPAERSRVGITDGLVRLSVGIEDVEDLIADLREALGKL